jgi:hypothetical protein
VKFSFLSPKSPDRAISIVGRKLRGRSGSAQAPIETQVIAPAPRCVMAWGHSG